MGISAKEILEMITELKKAIVYWTHCQPHIVPEDLMSEVVKLENKLIEIIKQ